MSQKTYTVVVQLGGLDPQATQQTQLLATLLKLIEDYRAALGGSSLAVASVVEV